VITNDAMTRTLRAASTSLWLILIVAFAMRAGFAVEQSRKIPRQALSAVPFLYETGDIAYSVATGNGFSSPFRVETGPTAWLTPVYPLFVAAMFRIFGTYTFAAFVATIFFNILFSTLACIPLFYAGKRIAGLGVAASAAWLWALFPNAIIIPFEWIWDTSLSTLLAATLLWATLALADSDRLRNWCAYGLLWGFILMTNPTFASLLPFLLGWLAYRAYKERHRWLSHVALASGIAILCCIPWTIRNYLVFHAFVPLRSNLGLELWLGNNDAYRERWPGWLHPIDSQAEREKYAASGEMEYVKEKRQEAIQFIVSHPRLEAHLFRVRFVALWTGSPAPWKDFVETRSLFIRFLFLCNFLAAIGTLGGLVVLYRKHSPFLFPVLVFPLVFPCAYYFTRALLRYRHPIDPIVLLLTALAVAELLQIGARSDPHRASAV
jgi:4-amino-4-deoxy-L-arabinose transferase-like glycosyltransferase